MKMKEGRHGLQNRVERGRAGILGLAALSVLPAPATGQTGMSARSSAATLEGIAWDSTTASPLAGARVVLLGTDLATEANQDGSFAIDGIPPGTYPVSFHHPRVQGTVFSFPARAVSLAPGETARVDLAIPSVPTLLAIACVIGLNDASEGALVGTVTDAGTGIPLPRARIAVRWNGQEARTTADGDGVWLVCGVPVGAGVVVKVDFPGRQAVSHALTGSAGPVRRQDVELTSGEAGTVFGTVLDASTSMPLASAQVVIPAIDARVVTDAEGHFILTGLRPGTHQIEVDHLAYGRGLNRVRVPDDGRALDLTIRLSPQAIELEPLVVTVESMRSRARVSRGTRFTGLDRAEIDEILPRINDTASLLRATRMPGLTVTKSMHGVCVQLNRVRGGSGCNHPDLYVNGVRIAGVAAYLDLLPPENIERFEILSPLEAGAIYGTGSGNGVILIETRDGRPPSPGSDPGGP